MISAYVAACLWQWEASRLHAVNCFSELLSARQAFLSTVERLEERLCMAIDLMTVGECIHELLNWACLPGQRLSNKTDLNQGFLS
jgi:hypothetical protein